MVRCFVAFLNFVLKGNEMTNSTTVKQLQTALIRRQKVQELTGLSRSGIYEKMSRDVFPKPISLGEKSVAWLEVEIHEWIASRIADSRKAA